MKPRFLNWIVGSSLVLAFGTAALAQDKPEPTPSATPAATPQNSPPTTPPTAEPTSPTGEAKPAAEGDQPKIKLSMEQWDFGQKWYGEKAEADITIKNEGKAPLKIVNIKTSCGCTAMKPKSGGQWNNKVIAPGESEDLTLSYNTKKNATKVTQTVTIESNDPERPSISFQVKGEVRNLFSATPADRITFGRIEREDTASQTVELTSNMEGETINLKLQPLPENSKYDVKLEEIEAGKKYKLIATTKPPLDLGANAINVVLETGREQNPTINIPISAYIAPRVSVTPPKLFVSPKLTQPFTKTVRVMYRPDKPVKITGVDSSSDKVTTEIIPPSSATPANPSMAFHEIRVSMPAPSDLPAGGAKLTIHTDDPSPEYQNLTVDIVLRDTSVPQRANLPTNRARPARNAKEGDKAGAHTEGEAGHKHADEPKDKPAEKPADEPKEKPADPGSGAQPAKP